MNCAAVTRFTAPLRNLGVALLVVAGSLATPHGHASLSSFAGGLPWLLLMAGGLTSSFLAGLLGIAGALITIPVFYAVLPMLRVSAAQLPWQVELPFNRAPPLHISLLVLLWVRFAMSCRGVSRIALHGWMAAIGVSVLTTWQHDVIDVVSGLAVGAICLPTLSDWLQRLQGTHAEAGEGA